jgi:hypothetical protein
MGEWKHFPSAGQKASAAILCEDNRHVNQPCRVRKFLSESVNGRTNTEVESNMHTSFRMRNRIEELQNCNQEMHMSLSASIGQMPPKLQQKVDANN